MRVTKHTGSALTFYTMATVRVVLHLIFSGLVTTHQFGLAVLATGVGIPYAIIDMMLADGPLPIKEAWLVLHMVSRCTYTLEHGTVRLLDGGMTDGTAA